MQCRRFLRILPLIAVFSLLAVSWTPDPAARIHASELTSASVEAHSSTGVKIRKLHLVRPDLIPYPIAYEIFC